MDLPGTGAPLHVALLSDAYLPRLGGIEVQVRDLAAALVAAGHRVTVVTGTASRPEETVDDDGVCPVVRLGTVSALGARWDALAGPAIERALTALAPDVVHIHMGIVTPFAALSARSAYRLGLPTCLTWHSMLGYNEPFLRIANLGRVMARHGVAMSAVSSASAVGVQRLIGRAGTVAVLPNGIDVEAWRPAAPHPTSAPRQPIRLISAMRLVPRKRPIALIEIVRRARRATGAPIELTIVGDGRLGRTVRAYARLRGGDWLHLPGRVSRRELKERFHEADGYVCPSRLESFGIAGLEARCAGLPVLGRTGTGMVDFITDGVSGYLARGDAELAARVADLATDADLREAMAVHNATTGPDQTWDRVVARTLAEYARAGQLRLPVRASRGGRGDAG